VHGDFEWDDAKAATNIAKHGVGFEEAAIAMRDDVTRHERRLYEEAE
jgi:uncharacterized DUF497 family protein